jgi:magnesium-protoporphyrin O-methyltransferase
VSGSCCQITDHAFSESEARYEARHYRRHGPAARTREILNRIRELGLKGTSLLDIGGGIGVIHHELLRDVADTATHVDASSAYLAEARAEAARLGNIDRVRFVHADFTDVADDLPEADIATLDRVVCCYPDFRRLLTAAAGRTRRVLAISYPREIWYMRLGLGIINIYQRLRSDPFRAFLHSVSAMDALLRGEGLRRISLRRFLDWEVAMYSRS